MEQIYQTNSNNMIKNANPTTNEMIEVATKEKVKQEEEEEEASSRSLSPILAKVLFKAKERRLRTKLSSTGFFFINNRKDRIPDYLMPNNPIFEQTIRKATINEVSTIKMETLRQIAILIDQYTIMNLEKSLWQTFLLSGTGSLKSTTDGITPKYWPEKFKAIIKSMKNIDYEKMTDENYCHLVQAHLHQLETQQKQNRMKLIEKIKHFSNYFMMIKSVLQPFVREHLQPLFMETEYEILLIGHDYESQRLDLALQKQACNDDQIQVIERLCCRKYECEKSRHEVTFLKHCIQENKSLYSLHSTPILTRSFIEIIHDPAMRQHLFEQQQKIVQRYDNDLMKWLLTATETSMIEKQKLFDYERVQFWQIQSALPSDQRFNYNVIDLIEQRLTNIIEKLRSIYNYKRYQSFGTIAMKRIPSI